VAERKYKAARELWPTVGPAAKSEYLRETISAHVVCICKGLGIERNKVTTGMFGDHDE
jgi:hypothetical protein